MKRRVQYEKIDMFRYCSSRLQTIEGVPQRPLMHAGTADDSAAAAAKPAAAAATEADDVDMAGAADTDADAALQAALALSKQSDDSAAGASASGLAGYGLPADFQGHYEFFAIVSHIGRSANSGHYIGWARRETAKTTGCA